MRDDGWCEFLEACAKAMACGVSLYRGAVLAFSGLTQPGDVVVFHMRTLHGAKGNSSSSTHRRVLSTRWLGEYQGIPYIYMFLFFAHQ